MKLRTPAKNNSQLFRYIAVGGFILLFIDVYLKLTSLSNTSPLPVPPTGILSADTARTPDHPDTLNPAEQQPPVKQDIDVEEGPCQEFILYYKPPKTGSTALTDAAREFVSKLGHSDYRCGMMSCGPYAEGVCTGRLQPRQLLGHLNAEFATVDCLKEKNYYVVTSNREPLERWRSAYRYNIQHKKSHYGIPWSVSYTEWMERVPECILLNYYDGKGNQCGDEADTDARIAKIVSMVDEVVDLYDDSYKGELHRLIEPFLGESNVSDVGNRTIEYPDLPKELDDRLIPERKLYDALKKRSMSPPAKGRKLCVRDVHKATAQEEEDVEG